MSVRLTRLLSAALIGSCLATTAFAASQTLVWRGDDATARGVADGVAKAWQQSGHGRVTLQPFNTASGLDAVSSGSADIAGSARGSSGSAEDSRLVFTPVAWDGLVLITNPSNPVSSLTLKQLHDIYYGKITNWREVGGRDEPIDVFAVASPGDGVEFSLRTLLFGRGNQPVAAPRQYVNTRQLEQSVTLDPRSLGATTLASVAGNSKVKMLHIDGSAPSSASVASGSYPLYTPVYLVTNPSSANAGEAKAFVDFAASAKGKAALRGHHLVPYGDGQALVSMDSPRRSRILAEVGARASSGTPISAPGATYASRAASAPTSARTLAARDALAARNAEHAARPQLSSVASGVVAAPEPSSLKGVHGEAITVAAAGSRGSDFGKVTADTYVTHERVASHKAEHVAKKDVQTAKPPHAYRVTAGETLYSIARKHGVEVAQVRSWNHLKDDQVHPGQVLRLSAR